ncbi:MULTISPECIES: GNAT family N-acetyltransferase [unclassified Tenacibaculum]|uniref:GNAT family N-acetyltransferase n=1 Tax=unclassified Tenacibaculum TaxID=2635139 RepID=UPI001F2E4A92|nr:MULTISPECIES: GNAT family N-acetyltransferase [unclassified Tenacibaculum]MCF2875104.1 GNAT family N-acetyltransferase [Tenacibaculum sp. Cn5-1]MCF2935180.1 GNAT family N-acetyltransferase [Tenacibaculum sp. Cn5-34]MCG7511378.1 GNAT family N-acetyltransferase [Tenacibaculum sp. Cn5-46]
MQNYLFTSNRLGFRNWTDSDLDALHEINSNPEVMRYFPTILKKEQTLDFIHRMQKQFNEKKLCYFAVEIIETKEFIGFIGLSEQTYAADFNPSIDIGWRLHPNFWGKGYATEGAKRCLEYGFSQLKLKEIVSVAPIVNTPSIIVMEKINMKKVKEFKHPLLGNFPKIEACVLYKISD